MNYKTRIVEYAQWGWGRPNPYFCAATRHNETELIRLVSGSGEIYIDGERFTLKQGDLYIVRPFILHAIRRTGDEAPVVDYVKADLRLLASNCPTNASIGDYLPFFNEKNAPVVVYGDSIRYNADRIIAPLFDEKINKEQMQRAVYDLLKLLYEHRKSMHSPNITEERQHYAAETALEYLSTNYAKQIKVSDVANLVGYDEFYTMKLFKRFCGWSIVDYLNGLRLTEARKQLETTHDSVSEIAATVGYQSASYFNRQFKKTFGITPTELRAQKIDNGK